MAVVAFPLAAHKRFMALQEWSDSRGELLGKVQIPAVSLVKLLFLEKHFDSCWGLRVSPSVQNQTSSKWWYVKQHPCFCLHFVKLGQVCVTCVQGLCWSALNSFSKTVAVPVYKQTSCLYSSEFLNASRGTECWTEPFFSHLYCTHVIHWCSSRWRDALHLSPSRVEILWICGNDFFGEEGGREGGQI